MVETYKDRIRWALGVAEGEPPSKAVTHSLAAALGVSYTAAMALLDLSGKTKQLKAHNNAVAAQLAKIDPNWLATGKGEARPKPPSGTLPFRDLGPFESQLITLFRRLAAKEQHEVLVALNNMIPKTGKASETDPFPNAGRGKVRGISQFSDLELEPDPTDERKEQ